MGSENMLVAFLTALWTVAIATASGHLTCYCTEGVGCTSDGVCNITSSPRTLVERCDVEVHISNNAFIRSIYRCVNDTILVPCEQHSHEEQADVYLLCCTSNMCNMCDLPASLPPQLLNLVPHPTRCSTYPPFPQNTADFQWFTPTFTPEANTFDDAYIIAPVVAVSLIGICIATFTCTTIALRKKLCKSPPTAVISIELEGTVCSSGHASMHTIQKNILDEVHLDRTVDNGKFGRVYRGEWRHEHVAVKIFEPKNTSSWDHEKMIYETAMFHHVNVLHCIMSGLWNSKDSHTELWMVLEYHENGSLFQYLKHHTLRIDESHQFITSIMSGLQHLHLPIISSTNSKPGIAHRDLKTKNILVKRGGICCLADFGLAVRQDLAHLSLVEKVPPHPQQGTVRYMAPEVLDGSVNMRSFGAFKAADMYALGLVVWEVLQRTDTKGPVPSYTAPFEGSIPHDPTVEEMKAVVNVHERRPEVDPRWAKDKVLAVAAEQMQECWRGLCTARPPISLVNKKLQAVTCS